MSTPNDRSPGVAEATPSHDSHAGEGLIDRIKVLLGLKSAPSFREDLADALEDVGGDAQSDFSPEERAMLRNILSLRGKRVDDVMVPRADVIAVPLDISLADLLGLFQTAGHSRLPVYGETLDDPRGMVHIRDFVAWLASRAKIASKKRRSKAASAELAFGTIDLSATLGSVKSLVRSVLFVPPSMPAVDLLAKMQTTRTQLALVIDEYGGTDGLVSMEDIVEIVLGDIEDEHDEDDADQIVPNGAGIFTADARADLEDVARAIGIDLSAESAEADVDTLGGWLVTLAGRVPVRGEIVQGPGVLEFEILDADPRRVKRVRIHTTGDTIARPRANGRRARPSIPAKEAGPMAGHAAEGELADAPAADEQIPGAQPPETSVAGTGVPEARVPDAPAGASEPGAPGGKSRSETPSGDGAP